MPFIDIVGDEVNIYPHMGQILALQSIKRIVAVVSGAQGGKTSLGPIWLQQEIQRRGPGDYMVVCPTFSLLDKSALPKFREWFEDVLKLGRYIGSPSRRFILSSDGEKRLWGQKQVSPTTIHFGYASDPNSLEAITLKAAWLDECGQKEFRAASWENIFTRRLAVHEGRVLLTTTPYSIEGFLKALCDQADAGDENIDLIRFDSTANPAFPQESWEQARKTMPSWKFDLFFRGIFSRPAGLIYESFKDSLAPTGHLIKRFEIPATWKRYLGMDFGGVNTAGVYVAEGQDSFAGKLIIYKSYHAGGLTASSHVAALLKDEPAGQKPTVYGGAKSEDQWRNEFTAAGLKILAPPVSEVEVGIDRVFAGFAEDQILIFDDLRPLLTELRSYSRKVDENGEVTEEIDKKSTFHHADSLRYIISHLRHSNEPNRIIRYTQRKGGFA